MWFHVWFNLACFHIYAPEMHTSASGFPLFLNWSTDGSNAPRNSVMHQKKAENKKCAIICLLAVTYHQLKSDSFAVFVLSGLAH